MNRKLLLALSVIAVALRKTVFVSALVAALLAWSLPIMADESATDQAENIFSSMGAKTPGDILWHCDVQTTPNDIRIVGLETLRDTIWISGAGSSSTDTINYIHVWLRSGGICQYLYSVQQTGSTSWGFRDLAADNQYLYGTADNFPKRLRCFYVTPGGMVDVPANNINVPGLPSGFVIRAVAYDENNNKFWCKNWSSKIYGFNRSGVVTDSFPDPLILSVYGMAYDNVTPGGPYLWCHVQDSTNVYQFDLVNGVYTGVVYSGWGDDDPGVNGIAGGLCVLERNPSKGGNVTLLGITQMVTPAIDELYAMEIYVDPFSVLPGVDLWSTPCGGATVDSHFTVMPLPPGFFGPGSDPFAGDVAFKGKPLSTTPPGILGPSDAIVERKTLAPLPAIGDSFTVPIEIIALSLTSISPITVTYNGGSNPELWDVDACLSSTQPQNIGSMIIRRGCDAGGTFSATLPVTPKFIFIRQSDLAQRVLDLGGMLTINFETERLCKGQWTYSDPGFGIFTSPGGLTVDHDCNPSTPEVPVGAGSNFFPGVQAIPCDSIQPPQKYKKLMTHEEAQLAAHGVLPPEQHEQDRDNDCIPDTADNCPDIPNPYQTDSDCDGVGDACEQESLYWKPPYQDYAPSGMPDLSQTQANWVKDPTGAHTFCGPCAVANCFKWFDSKYNQSAPGVPGDGFDRFPLVRDYLDGLPPLIGPLQDDHDPNNMDHPATPWLFGGTPAPPATPQPFIPGFQNPPQPMIAWGELVERLAYYFNTDGVRTQYCSHSGTEVHEMYQGIQNWFSSEHFAGGSTLSDTLCVNLWQKPTFALVETLVEKCEDVILLLGFWYEYPAGSQIWYRCGGHYVTVAGVNSQDYLIAVSDPMFDWAEMGNPGRVLNGQYIPHTPGHAQTAHNDEGNVSHDLYHVIDDPISPGGLWELVDYVLSQRPWYCYDLSLQNIPTEFQGVSVPWPGGDVPVITEVEYAVQISPWDYRGDVNGDGKVNVNDVVYLINYLFVAGSPPPVPTKWEGDVNCDGNVNVNDVVYLINYLFVPGSPAPCRVCDP